MKSTRNDWIRKLYHEGEKRNYFIASRKCAGWLDVDLEHCLKMGPSKQKGLFVFVFFCTNNKHGTRKFAEAFPIAVFSR